MGERKAVMGEGGVQNRRDFLFVCVGGWVGCGGGGVLCRILIFIMILMAEVHATSAKR